MFQEVYKILSFNSQHTFKVDVILHFIDNETGSKGLSNLSRAGTEVSGDSGLPVLKLRQFGVNWDAWLP